MIISKLKQFWALKPKDKVLFAVDDVKNDTDTNDDAGVDDDGNSDYQIELVSGIATQSSSCARWTHKSLTADTWKENSHCI